MEDYRQGLAVLLAADFVRQEAETVGAGSWNRHSP
jgi:hypothetical protein